MKKLMYTLLVLAYVTVAYLSVYVLPHYYCGAIIGAAGASLGASFKQFKEVRACPDQPLLAYFKWDKKKTSSLLLVLLGISFIFNFYKNIILKTHESFMRFLYILCPVFNFFIKMMELGIRTMILPIQAAGLAAAVP